METTKCYKHNPGLPWMQLDKQLWWSAQVVGRERKCLVHPFLQSQTTSPCPVFSESSLFILWNGHTFPSRLFYEFVQEEVHGLLWVGVRSLLWEVNKRLTSWALISNSSNIWGGREAGEEWSFTHSKRITCNVLNHNLMRSQSTKDTISCPSWVSGFLVGYMRGETRFHLIK